MFESRYGGLKDNGVVELPGGNEKKDFNVGVPIWRFKVKLVMD